MWLSAEERALAEYRLALEADGEEDTVKGSVMIGLKEALIDPKVWLLVLIQTCAVIGMSFTVCCQMFGLPLALTATVLLPIYRADSGLLSSHHAVAYGTSVLHSFPFLAS
jgi:hypothetical protein